MSSMESLDKLQAELSGNVHGDAYDRLYNLTVDVSIEHAELMALAAKWIRKERLEPLEAENAKLRVERDEWHRVAVSKQDIIDHMRDTSSSNMRLRELCADMFDGMCDHDHCYTCHHWKDGYNGCEYHDRMAQLGVEVDS